MQSVRSDVCHKVSSVVLLFLLLPGIGGSHQIHKRGVMDNFQEGLKLSGQIFGINTASDVANLVARAFFSADSNGSNNNGKQDLLSTFLQHRRQPLNGDSPTDSGSFEHAESQVTEDIDPSAEEAQRGQQSQYEGDGNTNIGPDSFLSSKVVTNVLRLIGFDARKLGALAINALIMVAQAIGKALMSATKTKRGGDDTGPNTDHQPRRMSGGDSPFEWLQSLGAEGNHSVFEYMTKSSLVEHLTGMIDNMEQAELGGNDVTDSQKRGACLKMLMCKSSPLIWGMQRSVKDSLSGESHEKMPREDQRVFNVNALFTHLPSITEYRTHGLNCEMRYADQCNTTRLSNDKQH